MQENGGLSESPWEKRVPGKRAAGKGGGKGRAVFTCGTAKGRGTIYFFQNFLQPLLSILKRLDDSHGTERRKTGLLQVPGKQFGLVRLDSFEIRFALRMSVVLAVTFSYLFASGIVIGQYAATPGTWQQAFFSTCYGLAMTTLALSEKTALELRMLYVGIAVVVVLIVNKFFFPTSLKSQFRYNFQFLFHMQHLYLRILENCLNGKKIAYDAMCSAQLRYHLVHEQLMQYLKRQEMGQSGYYRKLLSTSWKMISEKEQMFVLVNAKDWEEGELK